MKYIIIKIFLIVKIHFFLINFELCFLKFQLIIKNQLFINFYNNDNNPYNYFLIKKIYPIKFKINLIF